MPWNLVSLICSVLTFCTYAEWLSMCGWTHGQSPGSREDCLLNVSHQSSDAAPLTLGFLLTWQEMGTIQELSVQQQLDILPYQSLLSCFNASFHCYTCVTVSPDCNTSYTHLSVCHYLSQQFMAKTLFMSYQTPWS